MMKKRIFSTLLICTIALSLLLPGAGAAGSSLSLVATNTGVKADRVVNFEGYGSLTIDGLFDENNEQPPTFALLGKDGKPIFDYGVFPCEFAVFDGKFVNGVQTVDEYGYPAGRYTLFDLNGKQVINKLYDYLSFYNGYGVAITQTLRTDGYTETRQLIDAQGNVVLTLPDGFNLMVSAGGGPFAFEEMIWDIGYFGNIGGYSDGLLWMQTGADIKNNISEAQSLTEESTSYRDNAYQLSCFGGPYCGYIDLKGNVVIKPQFYGVTRFSDGLAAVQEYVAPSVPISDLPYDASLGGDWFFIDKTGKQAFSGRYADASWFEGGYAYVANSNGKYGYIDTTGKTVIPLQYDDAFGAGDGELFTVGKQSGSSMKYGLVDQNNRVVVPLEYDDISTFIDGVAYGIKNGTVYTLTKAQPEQPSAWAAEQVQAAIDAGLVPDNLQQNYTAAVSRGDVAEMFIRLIEQSTGKGIDAILREQGVQINENAFTDTSDPSVLAANALGIINGMGGGRFDPNGTFTRAQIAAILNRTAAVLGVDTAGYTHSFQDVSGHWVDDELGWPVHANIINGVGGGRFDPDGALTTEQAIAISYRALQALR